MSVKVSLALILIKILIIRTSPVSRFISGNLQSGRVRRDTGENSLNKIIYDGKNNTSESLVLEGIDAEIQDRFEIWLQTYWRKDDLTETIAESQAKLMQESMDLSYNPCYDFYEYACGNWNNGNAIPKDRSEINLFSYLNDYNLLALRNVITDDENNSIPDENDARLKAKNLFKSCMDDDSKAKVGSEPLIKLLDSLGGWPVLDPLWNDTDFDWLKITAEIRKLGFNVLLELTVMPDLKDHNKLSLYYDQAFVSLSGRDDFLDPVNKHRLSGYKFFMQDIMTLLGANVADAMLASIEIVKFETELANISQENTDFISFYEKYNLSQVMEEVPGIDIQRHLSLVFEKDFDNSQELVILCMEYLKDLAELVSHSEPKTIANYLLWRVILLYSDYLDQRFDKAMQDFSKAISGEEILSPPWHRCVDEVNLLMKMATGAMYVEKYFDEQSKNDITAITKDLQHQFKTILKEIDWIDLETKENAFQKVEKISLKIGYPDSIIDPEKLNIMYNISIDSEQYFESIVKLYRLAAKESLYPYEGAVNREEWIVRPAAVNAHFVPTMNEIIIPAGILQPPLYHRDFPKFLKYAGIGSFIGHELTHGFDSSGHRFDANGDVNNWWSDEAMAHFTNRSECFIDQYSKYILHGSRINGQDSNAENIADNGGVRQSYRAYRNWLTENEGNDELLKLETVHGLNLTSLQLFFLGYAQMWCGAIRPESVDNRIKTDIHTPGKFRVIGTLSNSEEFAKEFNCKAGTKMNPVNKCRIW